MTAHLVIADVDTIVALEQSDPLIWECYHADRRCDCPMTNKLTGDTWLFRTPEAVATRDARADWVYVVGTYPVTQLISPTILPLIAACDLLGIEEL